MFLVQIRVLNISALLPLFSPKGLKKKKIDKSPLSILEDKEADTAAALCLI